MSVAIAGGGIAGLTLAFSLHQVGIACRVYPSAYKKLAGFDIEALNAAPPIIGVHVERSAASA